MAVDDHGADAFHHRVNERLTSDRFDDHAVSIGGQAVQIIISSYHRIFCQMQNWNSREFISKPPQRGRY
jgi:hypothetical protein